MTYHGHCSNCGDVASSHPLKMSEATGTAKVQLGPRAERGLRPAVIARKLSCGNKTAAGKTCFEVLTTLATTCGQRGHDFVTWLAESLPLVAEAKPVPARA